MKTKYEKQAQAAQFVRGVVDLPQTREPADYTITDSDGLERQFTVQKRKRQVLELLMQGPVHCASPVRLSDVVFILKDEIGLEIETKMHPGNPQTGSGTYGIYHLRSQVTRAPEARAAA